MNPVRLAKAPGTANKFERVSLIPPEGPEGGGPIPRVAAPPADGSLLAKDNMFLCRFLHLNMNSIRTITIAAPATLPTMLPTYVDVEVFDEDSELVPFPAEVVAVDALPEPDPDPPPSPPADVGVAFESDVVEYKTEYDVEYEESLNEVRLDEERYVKDDEHDDDVVVELEKLGFKVLEVKFNVVELELTVSNAKELVGIEEIDEVDVVLSLIGKDCEVETTVEEANAVGAVVAGLAASGVVVGEDVSVMPGTY